MMSNSIMFRLFYTHNQLTTHTSPIEFKSARRSINNQKRKRNKIWEHEILKWFRRPTNKPAIQSNYHYYFTILNEFDKQQEKERITQQYFWVSIRFSIFVQQSKIKRIRSQLLWCICWSCVFGILDAERARVRAYTRDRIVMTNMCVVRASTRSLTHTQNKKKLIIILNYQYRRRAQWKSRTKITNQIELSMGHLHQLKYTHTHLERATRRTARGRCEIVAL